MNLKNESRKIAYDVMHLANRRGYGFGECGYYFEIFSFEAIQENYDAALDYDIDNGDGINWEERKKFQAEQPELYKQWRELVIASEEFADKLEEMGINKF